MFNAATVEVDDQRARIYRAGGVGYDQKVPGIGWVVCDEPSEEMVRVAMGARCVMFGFPIEP